MKKALNAVGETASVVNAVQFTYSLVDGAIHWYHNKKHHHSINLSPEEKKHLAEGGTIECEYACGNVLRAKK